MTVQVKPQEGQWVMKQTGDCLPLVEGGENSWGRGGRDHVRQGFSYIDVCTGSPGSLTNKRILTQKVSFGG